MENKVELLGFYGSDYTHALSAWCSTHRDLSPDREVRMPEFLKMLATSGHHTPFEKSMLHFLIDSEVASHIQMIKHRIGVSLNSESARYKEFKEDRFYIPEDWDESDRETLDDLYHDAARYYHHFVAKLTPKLGRKRAKESARFILPYGHMITSDISFNFRSFMHFQKLRNDDSAQLEVKKIAGQMLDLTRQTGKFDLSLKAFGY